MDEDVYSNMCRTISLIAHTVKIVARILRKRIERKIEDVLGENQFGFRRAKGTRDGIGMLRIISERTLDMDQELCACFIDWKKAFERVKWTTLMQILKGTGRARRRRRLVTKLYMDESVKARLGQVETRNVKTGRGVTGVCSHVADCINVYSEYLTQEALEGFGDFKIGGQVMGTVKYADDLVLLAKEETVLQSMIDRLTEIGRR
jgi:hypothetical protein